MNSKKACGTMEIIPSSVRAGEVDFIIRRSGPTTTSNGTTTYPTRAPRERALLVGIDITSQNHPWHIDDSLDELVRLADTAGLDVVGVVSQKLAHPNPKFYIGTGKLQEIARLKSELQYDLLVFDDELSPAQARNIEEALKTRVIDRTTLILDIFASHAHTREGRLQVELAQYEYLLPRLRRQWTHLERQAGGGGAGSGVGVGLRGPGETQLETDRRIIRRRIAHLKEQLGDVHRQRQLYRQRRKKEGIPIISLVGYTNAGKSTLLNALADANVLAVDQLFATLDPTTRKVVLPGGRVVLVTDTVGFIQRLPTALVAAFRATLEEIEEADLLLHVLDITHPNAEEQAQTVQETLTDLHLDEKPILTVLNKVDQLEGMDEAELSTMAQEMELPGDYVAISAARRWGMTTLLERIEQTLAGMMEPMEVLLPYSRNDLVALWHERGVIDEECFEEQGTLLRGRVPIQIAGQYAPYRLGVAHNISQMTRKSAQANSSMG